MTPNPPRAAVPAQPDALRLADALEFAARNADMGRKPVATDFRRRAAAELRRLHAQVAALTAAQPTHEQIAAYLEATGAYVTNDATREAAIADAIAADRASQGAAERAVPAGQDKEWPYPKPAPAQLVSNMTDPAVEREAFEEFAKMDTSNVSLVRDGDGYVDMAAALVWHGWEARAARAAAPVSNMTGGTYAELPEGWPARFRCDSCGGNGEVGDPMYMGHFQPPERARCPDCDGRGWCGEEPAFSADHVRDFADRTHALRASHAQAPAGAVGVVGRTIPRDDDQRAAAQFFADNPSVALLAFNRHMRQPTPAAQAAPAAGAVAGPDLQPLHNLLYLAQRQTSLGAMQRVVGEARLELAKVREAAPTPTAQASTPLKDHQIAALVNELRDIAVKFHATQQLRERIAHVVVPALRAGADSGAQEDAAASVLATAKALAWVELPLHERETYRIRAEATLRAALAAKGEKPHG